MKVVHKMFLFDYQSLLETTLYKILIFVGGILIGILLVMLIYLIISLIHKNIKTKPSKKNIINDPISEPLNVVNNYKNYYIENFEIKKISERLLAVKDISINLVKDIAALYYPASKDAYLEVSFENILDLTNRVVDKIEIMVNDIIDSSLFKIAWTSFASYKNITGFFKGLFKNSKEEVLSLNVKKQKISFIFEILDNSKSKEPKNTTKETKKIFLIDDFINRKVLSLIDEIAEEAILLYSNKSIVNGGGQ
jgi:hypothetical protein